MIDFLQHSLIVLFTVSKNTFSLVLIFVYFQLFSFLRNQISKLHKIL